MTSAPFDTALPLYRPEDTDLKRITSEGKIVNMTVERGTKKLILRVSFKGIKPYGELSRIAEGIRKSYGLAAAELIPRYDKALFCEGFSEFFSEYLRVSYPSLAGFFARSECAVEGNTLCVRMPSGTSEFALRMGVERTAQSFLNAVFDCEGLRVCITEGECCCEAERELDDMIRRTVPVTPTEVHTEKPKPEKKPAPDRQKDFRRPRPPKPTDVSEEDVLLGKPFGEENTPMNTITMESGRIGVCGEVFFTEFKSVSNGARTVATFDMTDKTGSVRVRRVLSAAEGEVWAERIKNGSYLRVRGEMEYDRFINDSVLKPIDIYFAKKPPARSDNAEKKRVELHMHTNLSAYDGVSSTASLVKRAEGWGMPAIAITDHGVTQAFPDALHAAKNIKILYGCEGYYVSTEADSSAVVGATDTPLEGEFVCFDLETTGTNPATEGITEISAVILKKGEIIGSYHTYVDPEKPIPPFITELTGITDQMVKGAPKAQEAVRGLREFCGDRVLVAHNAIFDVSFVNSVCGRAGIDWEITYIDTLEMSRIMLPDSKRHKLDYVARELKLPEFRHHSAEADAEILARIFAILLERLSERGVSTVSEINSVLGDMRRGSFLGGKKDTNPVRHILILVKNLVGLKNLYKLVSYGHLKYLDGRKRPIMPKHVLAAHREGLIIGSACEAGELYRAILEKKDAKEIRKIAKFYDFLEIQPLGNNEFMIRNGIVKDRDELIALNKAVLALGDELGIPVVATGDVHFLDPDDEVFRRIIMAGKGFEDADSQPPLYLRTTEEMLEEFSYLGDRAYEVVVENTNLIADMCESISPVPDGMFPPELPGSAEELKYLTYKKAYELYGDPLPEIVQKRVERELKPIIENGFDVMYMIAQKLIARSNEHGYLVGSRGSVGSSVVAYFAGITEINALAPHYRCPGCKYSEFVTGEADIGPDLPPKDCPVCGRHLVKDGFNIPFETFLGFNGDKAPDIDLNFSGDYQALAHRHTVELFGEDKVFRAGTLSTVADKTAFGYVRKYLDERGIRVSKAEENRLTVGCTGIKATTGQHPGGLIVVPKHKEIYDFCAIQHPPTDETTITIHIDYHSIDTNLLKLDILGKDDPTVIRYLEDNTGVSIDDVPIDDPDTLEIFLSNKTLGIEDDEITGPNGALGIPEYGTGFVRKMLVDTEPKTISDLVRISGLSHGTDVWLGNAETLIAEQGFKLKDCICCRDDIMNYLISMGVEPKLSFTIMEAVRKGKKLKPEWEVVMREHNLPECYIESCNKIGYLFPKAHAAAYVVMALRIAWFKVHRPLAYYGSWFTIKAKENSFDVAAMLSGDAALLESLAAAYEKAHEAKATATDKELVRTLEIAHEFLKRGFKFLPVDLFESDAHSFLLVPEENALRMPFRAVTGLGASAAASIVRERERGPFASMEEMRQRCSGVSETIIKELSRLGALGDMPESSQATLF